MMLRRGARRLLVLRHRLLIFVLYNDITLHIIAIFMPLVYSEGAKSAENADDLRADG